MDGRDSGVRFDRPLRCEITGGDYRIEFNKAGLASVPSGRCLVLIFFDGLGKMRSSAGAPETAVPPSSFSVFVDQRAAFSFASAGGAAALVEIPTNRIHDRLPNEGKHRTVQTRAGIFDPELAGAVSLLKDHVSLRDTPKACPTCDSLVELVAARVAFHLVTSPAGEGTPSAFSRAVAHIEANLDEAMTLADVAEVIETTPYRTARMFRQQTGRSLCKYVSERRLALARTLVVESDENLAEIAQRCGLGSQSYMTTVFKRALGVTPGQMRGRFQNDPDHDDNESA